MLRLTKGKFYAYPTSRGLAANDATPANVKESPRVRILFVKTYKILRFTHMLQTKYHKECWL